eukprot:8394925-Ditylum_brightwellii.AAC.1
MFAAFLGAYVVVQDVLGLFVLVIGFLVYEHLTPSRYSTNSSMECLRGLKLAHFIVHFQPAGMSQRTISTSSSFGSLEFKG